MSVDLTHGSVPRTLLRFAVPYLLSCFLQTFYGLADLYVVGRYNAAASITAVSIGSQVMHMLTVIIVGLAMGGTVAVSRAVGAGDHAETRRGIGNTATLFLAFSAVATALLLLLTGTVVRLLATPPEAVAETRQYLLVCFAGVPLITAYNVVSSVFRGLGDSVRPMWFVAIAGVVNLALDFLFIGTFGWGAGGAALATVLAQGLSVALALAALGRLGLGLRLRRDDFRLHGPTLGGILKVGVPIAFQDGLIQVSFLVITMVANSRGLEVAAAVGVVEKLIGFLFLVPSAMLSSVSAIVAQNAGAGEHGRGRQVLWWALGIVLAYGLAVTASCTLWAESAVALFVPAGSAVTALGGQYLRGYVHDCYVAGVHFCFSGYFCAYRRASLSFLHNIVSIVLARVPGVFVATWCWPDTLYPMGLAVPIGSLVSVVVCIILFMVGNRRRWFE